MKAKIKLKFLKKINKIIDLIKENLQEKSNKLGKK